MPPVGPWGMGPAGPALPRGPGRSFQTPQASQRSAPSSWTPRFASLAASVHLAGKKHPVVASLTTLVCLRLLQTGSDGARRSPVERVKSPSQLRSPGFCSNNVIAGFLMIPHAEALYMRLWRPLVKPDKAMKARPARHRFRLPRLRRVATGR